MEKYDIQMSEICREAFNAYYGSNIEFYIDEENTFWMKYPKSEKLYCVGTIENVEEMLLSMGGYGMDVSL